MSGFNPNGLGKNKTFGETEHDSLKADDASIKSGSVLDSAGFEDQHRISIPTEGSGSHNGFGCLVDTGSKLIAFYRDGTQHLPSTDDTIRAIDSPDYGPTWENDRVIFDPDEGVTPHAAVRMANDRIGVISTGYLDNSSVTFHYSDDEGGTWTHVDIGIGGGEYWAMNMIRYPESVGGTADRSGWFIPLQNDDGYTMTGITTTENGESWTDLGTLLDPDGSKNEFVVARVGETDRWVVVYRDADGGPPLEMGASRSTDLLNWEEPIQTDTLLGKNPPYLLYNGGNFHLFATVRAGGIDGFPEGILYQRVPALEIWDDLTAWDDWSLWTRATNELGYLDHEEVGGRNYFVNGSEYDGNDGRLSLYAPTTDRANELSTKPSDPDLIDSRRNNNYHLGVSSNSVVVAGDNSVTTIREMVGPTPKIFGAFCVIIGSQQDGTNGFSDTLQVPETAGVFNVNKSSRGLADGDRTYSFSSNNLELSIDRAGETYDVGVITLGGAQA